jgi:cardiolipin synthase
MKFFKIVSLPVCSLLIAFTFGNFASATTKDANEESPKHHAKRPPETSSEGTTHDGTTRMDTTRHPKTSTSDQIYQNASSPILSLINASKSSIDLEIYTMKDLPVIAALKAAMARGVKLRVVQTSYTLDNCHVFEAPSASDDPTCTPLKEFVTYVRANGGEYVPFNNELCGTPGQNCFQHGKILISDASKIMISTGNFDPTSLCDLTQGPTTCNRDFSLVTGDASVISTIQEVYNNDLKGTPFNLKNILGSPAADRVTISPDSMTPLLTLIQSAKTSIQVENQYLEDPTMNAALATAARRGVKVTVMVASVSAFGKLSPTKDAGQINEWTQIFTQFDQAGVQSKIFNGSMLIKNTAGYLHAKIILVDGDQAWVSSVNGSTESITENREYGILSTDPHVITLLNTVLSGDFANSQAETWQESLACKKDPKSDCVGKSNAQKNRKHELN